MTIISLAALKTGARGHVTSVIRDLTGRAERLAALGVTQGASVRVLQTFPVIVFECDQTEVAIERAMARAVLIAVTRDADA
ncbi:MAG: FeoA family protein [Vicinamibacterales bacterium]